MAVPVPNYKRIVCAAKRSGWSPTKIRAWLVRETFNPQIHRPLWNALIEAAGVEVPDSMDVRLVLSALLPLIEEEIRNEKPEAVADILAMQRDILEGVDQ